jgi:xanthine dehydrogenase small subunit
VSTGFDFSLNGRLVTVAGIDPNTTLLAFLRARGLTGTKESCAEGECGACAVAVVVAHGDGSRFQAVNSCLVLLPEIAGGEVWTVEGVCGREPQDLHPVQRLLVEKNGSQCGYCTPGFVMSLFAAYYEAARPDPRSLLAGNLCRCTGYRPICEAAAALPAPDAGDAHVARLRRRAPAATSSQYGAADSHFHRPTTLAECLALRAAHPDATLLAGGTDLVVEHNQDGHRHLRMIALGAVSELCTIEERAHEFVIGAAATWHEILQQLGDRVPLLAQMIPLFASPLIRARGTLGGNLMTASPVGDGAPVLLALDARVEVASATARRLVPLHEWFLGYRRTGLQADELLVAMHVPKAQPAASRFYKVSRRELDDISSVSAALAVWLDGGRVTQARFVFGGVAATPARAVAAERALVGRPLDAAALRDCQHAVRSAFTPIDDVRASAAYRTAMLESLLAKFWHEVAP